MAIEKLLQKLWSELWSIKAVQRAGGRRSRLNLGLVCCVYFVLSVFLVSGMTIRIE